MGWVLPDRACFGYAAPLSRPTGAGFELKLPFPATLLPGRAQNETGQGNRPRIPNVNFALFRVVRT